MKPVWRKEFPEGSHDYIGEGPRTIQLLKVKEQLHFERYFSPQPIKDLVDFTRKNIYIREDISSKRNEARKEAIKISYEFT